MITRLAMVVLSGMTGWLLRRPRSHARRPDQPATMANPVTQPTINEPAAPLSPPEDHFRRLRPRASAPPVAAIAARSPPVLGILGALLTLALAVGAVRGGLPFLGPIESANPAWALAQVTMSLWAVYLLWKVPQWQADAWARSGNSNPRELFEIENESGVPSASGAFPVLRLPSWCRGATCVAGCVEEMIVSERRTAGHAEPFSAHGIES